MVALKLIIYQASHTSHCQWLIDSLVRCNTCAHAILACSDRSCASAAGDYERMDLLFGPILALYGLQP